MELIIDNEPKLVDYTGPVSMLLKDLRLLREEVVVKVNGKLAPETKKVGKKDRVEIIKVVFGG